MWPLSFIDEEDFTNHVKAAIENYDEGLKSFDLKKAYNVTREEVVGNEIFAQKNNSNSNDIGYFHERIFQYIENCRVPQNGEDGIWNVIYQNPEGVNIAEVGSVKTIYVQMEKKNKTMNSESARGTLIQMQNQLLNCDHCACFLVEAMARPSQNIKWETTIDKIKIGNKRIRRLSIDQFYAVITGEKYAFSNICKVLPKIIAKVINFVEH